MHARRWIPFAFLAPALAGLLIFRFTPICLALIGSFFAAQSDQLQAGPELWKEIMRLIK